MLKKYIAELVGTFLLTLAVIASLHGNFPVPTPVIAGLTLGLMVYVIGGISGAHINPAVTVGVWSLGKIKMSEAAKYIIAQFIGAAIALSLGWYLGATSSLLGNGHINIAEMFAEGIGAVFFTFGIAAVVLEKVPAAASGLVIGGSLLLGLSLASGGSEAVLNPAVAFGISGINGIGSWGLAYVLAPILGSLVGMNAYRWLAK